MSDNKTSKPNIKRKLIISLILIGSVLVLLALIAFVGPKVFDKILSSNEESEVIFFYPADYSVDPYADPKYMLQIRDVYYLEGNTGVLVTDDTRNTIRKTASFFEKYFRLAIEGKYEEFQDLFDKSLYNGLAIPEKFTLAQAITLGAIATATAPAATLMVVRQYKADGPLTRLLLPIVALDDAVGLVAFAVSFGVAKTLVSGQIDLVSVLVNPFVEILASLLLGAVMGWVLTQLEKLFNSNTNRLNLTIGVVFLAASLSMLEFSIGPVHVHFSSLLVCMMLGTVFCNICPLSHDLMAASDKWTSPLFALFFVISGAELELGVFSDLAIVLIGAIYIIFRSLGKYFGAMSSALVTKCSPAICKYLGITLLPQAGVALGMCANAMQLGAEGNLIRNITLFAVLIYELFGPVFTRMALTAAGEIKPMSEEVKMRRHNKLNEAKERKGAQ
jgi:NhaP-type Na+/H+ or K+/H+ antiporter